LDAGKLAVQAPDDPAPDASSPRLLLAFLPRLLAPPVAMGPCRPDAARSAAQSFAAAAPPKLAAERTAPQVWPPWLAAGTAEQPFAAMPP